MRRRLIAWLVGLACLFGRVAAADPDPTTVVHVLEPFHVTLDSNGASEHFSPSFVVPDLVWTQVDAEMKRLQDQETRLTAENKSLTASVSSGSVWWKVALAGGALVAGALAEHYL